MEDLGWNLGMPIEDEPAHPGRIPSEPVPLCVCGLDVGIENE